MKQSQATPTNTIAGGNLASLQQSFKTIDGAKRYMGILTAIADCMDQIADGEDHYMLIGVTRNRDAFTLNWKGAGAPGAVYATDLTALSALAADLV